MKNNNIKNINLPIAEYYDHLIKHGMTVLEVLASQAKKIALIEKNLNIKIDTADSNSKMRYSSLTLFIENISQRCENFLTNLTSKTEAQLMAEWKNMDNKEKISKVQEAIKRIATIKGLIRFADHALLEAILGGTAIPDEAFQENAYQKESPHWEAYKEPAILTLHPVQLDDNSSSSKKEEQTTLSVRKTSKVLLPSDTDDVEDYYYHMKRKIPLTEILASQLYKVINLMETIPLRRENFYPRANLKELINRKNFIECLIQYCRGSINLLSTKKSKLTIEKTDEQEQLEIEKNTNILEIICQLVELVNKDLSESDIHKLPTQFFYEEQAKAAYQKENKYWEKCEFTLSPIPPVKPSENILITEVAQSEISNAQLLKSTREAKIELLNNTEFKSKKENQGRINTFIKTSSSINIYKFSFSDPSQNNFNVSAENIRKTSASCHNFNEKKGNNYTTS